MPNAVEPIGQIAMTLAIKMLHPMVAAEVEGLNLSHAIDDATFRQIEAALDAHGALLFRGPRLSDQAQIAFATRFGPLEENSVLTTGIKPRVSRKLADISNLDENDALLGLEDRRRMFSLGNQLWHTDSSFKRTPAKCSLLHAHAVT